MMAVKKPSTKDIILNDSDANKPIENSKRDEEIIVFWEIKEKYQIYSKLGEGGGGSVFSGVNRLNGQLVAIKVLKKSSVKRWLTINKQSIPIEVYLHQRACKRNKGVIELIEWFDVEGFCVIIMERFEHAIDLYDYTSMYRISEEQTADIARQLVDSVSIFNSRRIIHRDIKDENIVINPCNLTIKIIDFGCAAVSQTRKFKKMSGTEAYYPPEWFENNQYDGERLEVWTIGVLLYKMLTAEDVSEIKNNKFYWKENAGTKLKVFSYHCQDILSRILFCDETKRISLKELSNHPWLKR